jgi:hypothetical protein
MQRTVLSVLAWTALTAAVVFVILSLTALFAWESLGDTAPALAWYGAVPALGVAIGLALAMLVVAAFGGPPEEKPKQ